MSNFIASTFIAKELRFGIDARQAMLRGVERITRAVAVTLGPKGRNVIIDPARPQDHPKVTKDGVTVARSIAFADPFENVGAKLIRHASSRTNDVAGDGTTTTSVLTWSIFAEGYKSVATGTNPMDLKRGVDKAVEAVTLSLKKQARSVSTEAELANVATISANGDAVIGSLVAKAVHATGHEGVVRIIETSALDTTCEVMNGLLLPAVGFLDAAFVTDPAQQRVVFSRPTYVMVSDVPVESFDQVLPALNAAISKKMCLLVIAPKVGGVALQALLVNSAGGGVPCCAVEVADADPRQDIPCFLGAASVASGVIIDQTSTVILPPLEASPLAVDRAKYVRSCLDRIQAAESTDALRQRLANLVSRTAVLNVGGTTEVDCSEKKDRVIDAVCATRAALREGIVAGGGAALLYAVHTLADVKGENDDQNTGIQIVRNAIRLPCELIANNAGLQGGVIAQRILQKGVEGYGYDAQRDRYENMFEAGIVDPLLVVRTTLSDAASVAGLMLTTESIVCTESDEYLLNSHDPDGTLKKKSQVRFPLNNVAAGLEGVLNSWK